MKDHTKTRQWLQNLVTERIKKNPQFSLRAFAKMVGVSPAVLSRILTGKRGLTLNLATKISEALSLGSIERDKLYTLYFDEINVGTKKERIEKELALDTILIIKDWYHYGIIQLFYIDTYVEDPVWMASMLSISELEVIEAIERLLRLDILARNEAGELYRTATHLRTPPDVGSLGLRHFHKQILQKTMNSLDTIGVSERDATSSTMAINENLLPEAKLEIKKFKERMADLMEQGERTRVYNLNINFIPISKSTKPQKSEK